MDESEKDEIMHLVSEAMGRSIHESEMRRYGFDRLPSWAPIDHQLYQGDIDLGTRLLISSQYGDLHACPNCGAHRWGQTADQYLRDRIQCFECLHDYRRQDLLVGTSSIVGQD